MRKILMMAAYILLTLQCVGVYAGGKLPLEYGTKNLVVHEDTVKKGLSLKPWGIALKFLFLHHENILFPND